jgi:D-alanyl-D-alanine carboxypeptidase/D-alanyl-D-alanine-endopeptidase (penicillin-binding protein 4)
MIHGMNVCKLLLVAALWVAVGAGAPGGALAQGKPLPTEIETALARARIPAEAITVMVQEAGAPASPPRAAWNVHKPMNPASLAKLLTTYAALDELGPAFSWKTPIWFGGPVRSGGVLDGPLYIQGRGDPNLNLERLLLAVQRLRAMGITEIRGDIVIDQGAFDVPSQSPAEFDNEPLRPYNVASAALLLNLHAVITTFTPDPARGVAMVSVEPPMAGYAVDATVPLSNEPCNDWRTSLKAQLGDPNRLRFAGSYPAACGERFWPAAFPDARQYAQRALPALWQSVGGKLGGTVREGAAPANSKPTFELSSPPLAEIVRDINKYSNNVMAQQVFLSLPLHRSGLARVTPDDARAFLREWFALRVGGTLDGLVIDNGSGLSRQARVSASLLARLLQSAWASPVMPELMSSLPVTGQDGTLRRSKASSGRAHLKTGSLRDVNGAAGYVLGHSGKRYVVVALVNHPNAAAAKPVLDAAVQWAIADDAP